MSIDKATCTVGLMAIIHADPVMLHGRTVTIGLAADLTINTPWTGATQGPSLPTIVNQAFAPKTEAARAMIMGLAESLLPGQQLTIERLADGGVRLSLMTGPSGMTRWIGADKAGDLSALGEAYANMQEHALR